MSRSHAPADDLVYDLVSIQYHALKGAQLYEQFKSDADGHDEVVAFLDRVIAEDSRRAEECHELLRALTAQHGLAGDDGTGLGLTDGDRQVGEGASPAPGDGLGAGAASVDVRRGTVAGGGARTGISAVGQGAGAGGGIPGLDA